MTPATTRRTLLASCLLALLPGPALAWRRGAQSTQIGAVTIAVSALNLDESSNTWEFAVSLIASEGTVDDDLMEAATLAGTGGARQMAKPLAWEGDGPGRRHRVGVLRFRSLQPRPETVFLLISRKGEWHPRVYEWEFGAFEA
jgi:hypothetical protein